MATVSINPFSFVIQSQLGPGGSRVGGYGYGGAAGQIGIFFTPRVTNATALDLTPGVATTIAFADITQDEAGDAYHALEGTNAQEQPNNAAYRGVRRADNTTIDPGHRLDVSLSLSVTSGGDSATAGFLASAGSSSSTPPNGVELYVALDTDSPTSSPGLISDPDVDYRLTLGTQHITFANGDRLSIALSPVALSANSQTVTMQATFLLTAATVDDYPDAPATTGTVAVGGSATGTLEAAGDRDSFNVALTAGQTYSFVLRGQSSGGGTLSDPVLQPYDSGGAALVPDDDTFSLDSKVTYTATASGTYRLSVGGYNNARTGTYTLAVLPHANGTLGDDTVTDGADGRFYEAGSGRDALVLPGTGLRSTTVVPGSAGQFLLAHAGQTDVASGFEELRFLDGRLVYDASDPAAQAVRLYRAALGRDPDQEGLNHWIDRLRTGAPLSDLAGSFLGSAEFQARYGSLDDAGYVDRLYLNVLGRQGDTGGTAYWLGQLRTGVARQDVLAAFSDSDENKAGTAGLVTAGIWDRSDAAQQVARLYDAVLDRLPDAGGLGYWTGRIEDGTSNTLAVADAFAASQEFTSRYGTLTSRAFVETLYQNTLNRPGDQGGIAYWTGLLDAGALTRPGVVLAFSESPENVGRTAPLFGGEDRSTYGVTFAA